MQLIFLSGCGGCATAPRRTPKKRQTAKREPSSSNLHKRRKSIFTSSGLNQFQNGRDTVASGGSSRPPRNGCWIKVAARPSDNLPGVSMRWRSLHRYRANAPPGNIGVACGSPSQRPGRSRTATRCALPARFAVAAVTCWWPGQQVGRSVDCRNQSDGTCRERANSPSGCRSRRR